LYVRDGQEWPSYGAWLRSKNLKVEGCRDATGGQDRSTQKRWDRELDLYRSAVAQGIQPDGTTTAKVRRALDLSDKAGKPYNGETGGFGG
jgi:hypothetical protein